MDDLDPRLDQLAGLGDVPLAEPEPVDALRRRARRVRAVRTAKAVTALAVSVALVGAVVAVRSSGDTQPRHLRVAAPGFVLGDIDAVVFASSFDPDGARNPIPADLTSVVAHVPGVERVTGIVSTFAPVNRTFRLSTDQPPRTTILFSYHQPDEIHLTGGRLPSAAGEVVVDTEFLARNQLAVGDTPSVQLRGQPASLHIVGTFDLPGLDVSRIPLAAMAAGHQPVGVSLDRIDVKLAPGAEAANVRDAIATAVGTAYTVAPPSAISIPDQRLAQLEIQHAYWALLSLDPSERSTAVEGPRDPHADEKYAQHRSETLSAELRVEDVHFLSPDTATLTYRVFYGGAPSPVVNAPQAGAAVRIDGMWRLTSATVCALARADHLECPTPGTTGSAATSP